MGFGPISNSSGGGGNLPTPTGPGQIPVSNEAGNYTATDAGDVKVNTLEASGDISSSSVSSSQVNVASSDGKKDATTTPETIMVSDDNTGEFIEASASGIRLGTTETEAELTLDIISGLENTVNPITASNPPIEATTYTAAMAAAAAVFSDLIQGSLEVLPAFYQTGSTPGEFQLNGANKGIAMRFICPIDREVTSLSFHVSTLASAGTLTVVIYDMTNSSSHACGTTGSISATGWFRHTFTAVQLYRDHQYEIRVVWASGDMNISYHRTLVGPGTGFPETCEGYSTTDNWSTHTGLAVLYRESLPNFVLNSVASKHVPELTFGRRDGAYIILPGGVYRSIPIEGVSLDCTGLVGDTSYYVYAYSNAGNLAIEASTTVPVEGEEGVEVKTGETTKRLIGMIMPKVLISTNVGPVQVPDRLYVANIKGRPRKIGKRNPFASGSNNYAPKHASITEVSTGPLSWNNNDDWKVEFIVCRSSIVRALCEAQPADGPGEIAVGLDSKLYRQGESTMGGVTYSQDYSMLSAELISRITRGSHYLYPLIFARSGSTAAIYMVIAWETAGVYNSEASFIGEIEA